MATLIGLFTEASPQAEDITLKEHFHFWNLLLEPFNKPGEIEIAIFLPGILSSNEAFSPEFRRFSILGQNIEDQIRNVFELGFEKGFERVVFVHENWNGASFKLLKKATATDPANMLLLPNEDGSLAVWGMSQNHFWNWSQFDCFRPEIVVEMIGLCIENAIPYSLIQL